MTQKKIMPLVLAAFVAAAAVVGAEENSILALLEENTPLLEKVLALTKDADFANADPRFMDKVRRFSALYEDVPEIYRLADRYMRQTERIDNSIDAFRAAVHCLGRKDYIKKHEIPKNSYDYTIKQLDTVKNWNEAYELWQGLRLRLEEAMSQRNFK